MSDNDNSAASILEALETVLVEKYNVEPIVLKLLGHFGDMRYAEGYAGGYRDASLDAGFRSA